MKSYTAIYSTSKIKNIRYSFSAENTEKAIEFCSFKFNVPVSAIIENIDNIYDGDCGTIVYLNGEKL